ncbi:protein N-lysine methyltransferase METTL21D-like [Macrobrachium nipponense]|uniref:protein N-lysine methyltransferase METTL21D-like n=1 Tax=Macrobrachium nipponense TaxID=159736 RepID=UPI0030C8149A
MFVREVEFEDINKTLSIYQENEGDVGCVVWDAALVAAKYLERHREKPEKNVVAGCSVVELGAGTGFLGLAAALLGASQVTITDLPEFVHLMEKNIKENRHIIQDQVKAKVLEWGNKEHMDAIDKPKVILVADCIYYEQSLEPLISTLRSISGSHTTILLSYEERTSGNKLHLQKKFFELMDQFFTKTKIPIEDHHEVYSSDEIHLYKFCLK